MTTPVAQRAQVAARRTQAVEMRTKGETWESIANTLGYASRGAAATDVKRALEERLAEQRLAADELREIELEKLDVLERAVVAVLEREHVVVSGGRVVYTGLDGGDVDLVDADGGPVRVAPLKDDGPTLAAVDRYLRIQERRARLLGLDSPVRVDGTATVRYVIEGVEMGALQ